MNKKIIILEIIILLILGLFGNITIYAQSETTATFEASTKEVKPGDSFTVKLKVKCEDGINGVSTKYSYDKEVLELVTKKIGDGLADFSGDGEIIVMSNSNTLTEADVYTLTFKVKENVEANKNIVISTDKIMVDSNAAENSTYTIDEKSVTVLTVASGNSNSGDQNNNNQGSNNNSNNNGEQQNNQGTATGSGSSTTGTKSGNNSSTTTTTSGNSSKTTTTTTATKKDTTTSSGKLPQTGSKIIKMALIVGVAFIVAGIYLIKNIKYKGI